MADVPMEQSQSLDSIISSIKQYGTSGIEISPYLSAIQSLNGNNPSEKYKHFNTVVKKIVTEIQDVDTAFRLIEESQEIPSALKSSIKIHVANQLRVPNIILEALVSEDKSIVKQALNATWFFDNANPILQADYFITNVLPHLPVLTRHKVIKILSKTLIGGDKNAENLFDALVSSYSFEEALPLLPACSQDFIFNEILKRKLVLSYETLLVFYKRYPSLVIRYLDLGDYKNEFNKEDRKKHSINISNHRQFIPHLIRNHISHFLKYRSISNCQLPIGKTRTALFFKQASNEVVKDPKTFLQIWSIETISKKLTTKQFETMFFNLLPGRQEHFNLRNILDYYLRYYPEEKRLDLLSRSYKSKYFQEILSGIREVDHRDLEIAYDLLPLEFVEKLYVKSLPFDIKCFSTTSALYNLHKYPKKTKLKFFIDSFEKKYCIDFYENIRNVHSEDFLKLLPKDERETQAARLLNFCEKKTNEYYKWYMYMPLEKSFPIFKDAISESSLWNTRLEYIEKMLTCSKLSESKENLVQVLKYYIERHRNERIEFLIGFLDSFRGLFDLKEIDKEVWYLLFEIIQIAHVKGELVNSMSFTLACYFNAATYFILVDCTSNNEINLNEADEIFLNKIFDITADFIVDTSAESDICTIYKFSIERYSLDKLVNLLAIKYPLDNLLWQGTKGSLKKFNLAEGILRAFNLYNKQCIEKLNDENYLSQNLEVLKILEYPWLVELIKDSLKRDVAYDRRWPKKLYIFQQLIKETDIDAHRLLVGKIPEVEPVVNINIKSGAARMKLKENPQHVLDNWVDYFTECRNRLKKNSKYGGAAAKRFLLTLKWYGTLPNKFIERSFLEIQETGSIKILGILLENEVFSKIVVPLAPQTSTVDITNIDSKKFYKMVRSIPQAMNLTNPLISFDTILLFCVKDYLKLAIEAFTYVSQRISKTKILAFAEKLIEKPVAVKKQGIKLFFQSATEIQLQQFLRKMWSQNSNTSIRELIGEYVKDRFQNDPNSDTWTLLEICLENLKVSDEVPLKIFCENPVKNKYACLYLDLLIQKIEVLYENEFPELKEKFLCLLFENIRMENIQFITKEAIMDLLEKYYFETESEQIHKAAATLAKRIF